MTTVDTEDAYSSGTHEHRCGAAIENGSEIVDGLADLLYQSEDVVHDITWAFIHWVSESTERRAPETAYEKAAAFAIEERYRNELIKAVAEAKFS